MVKNKKNRTRSKPRKMKSSLFPDRFHAPDGESSEGMNLFKIKRYM